MHTRFIFTTLIALGLAMATSTATAQQRTTDERRDAGAIQPLQNRQEGAQQPDHAGVPTKFRASEIVGLKVRNKNNRDIGNINDLVVELNSGDIRYAALSFGGFAGFGDKLFAVPWEALTLKFGERDHFIVFDVTEEKLKQSHGFDQNNWPNVADPKWSATIDKHYNVERKPQEGDQKVARNIVQDTVFRVSTITGMEVRDAAGKDLGNINDLVLDLKEGKVKYGVLSHGGVVGIGSKLYAIPFAELKFHHTADEKFFALHISQDKLKGAPSFDANRWPNLGDAKWASDVDRFYGVRTAERPTIRKE